MIGRTLTVKVDKRAQDQSSKVAICRPILSNSGILKRYIVDILFKSFIFKNLIKVVKILVLNAQIRLSLNSHFLLDFGNGRLPLQ